MYTASIIVIIDDIVPSDDIHLYNMMPPTDTRLDFDMLLNRCAADKRGEIEIQVGMEYSRSMFAFDSNAVRVAGEDYY